MKRIDFHKGILLTAAIVSLAACSHRKAEEQPAESPAKGSLAAWEVKVAKIESRDFKPEIEVTGSLAPERRVMMAALAAGRIEKLKVDIGSRVKKGQVLFEIRKTEYRLHYNQAHAGLERAQTFMELSEEEKSRINDLYRKSAVSGQDNDRANATYKDAAASVKLARANRSSAYQALKDCTIKAPFDGIITAKLLQEGEYARVGDAVVEIMDLTLLNADLELPERYAGEVTLDLPVNLSCRSQSESVAGKVVAVNPKIDLGNRTFTVKVAVENPGETLQAGLFCTASFDLEVQPNQMAVPSEAVIRDGGASIVWVVKDGKAYPKTVVEGGKYEDGWVRVLEGLSPDDVIIVEGNSGLAEGQEVTMNE